MARKFSAYLSIFNDWDILPLALEKMRPYVDELVVVDGAYEWMVPYLGKLGIDPVRSCDQVYAAVDAAGIPFRVISRTWKNEIEKRQAGYDACAHSFVYRVDADEVLFFDDEALEAGLSSGAAIFQMFMPNYVAPGWVSISDAASGIPRQCFLFDKQKVTSSIHLNYLWLVLTVDERPEAQVMPFAVYEPPIAFNAHLTGWRTPTTSVNRAAFYHLNWMRENGVPWLEELRDRPLRDLRLLFDVVDPRDFLSSLSFGEIASGMIEPPGERTYIATPLDPIKEAVLTPLYERFLGGLAQKVRDAVNAPQRFLSAFPIYLDLSIASVRESLTVHGKVRIRFSTPLSHAEASLIIYSSTPPYGSEVSLAVGIHGSDVEIQLPKGYRETPGSIRDCLKVLVSPADTVASTSFQIVR